ncbi:hypothetical protein F511_28078 [Dorcoceras hygrometricum]|uniref:Uncharacterized protein n=1 Tax=Dorcoceras hygrometricum TaxID=472368 RepID=A0A2Z7CPB3_9LAMI|nr:hypothetical protein F511_28078 [Dorcoceras hygrometricum]
MACAMIKPAVVELEEKPAATQIQQRHKFSSWRLATQTSSSPRKFSTRSKILYTESFTMEIRKDSARVQGRLHAVTADLGD